MSDYRCSACGHVTRKLTKKELSEVRRQNAIKTVKTRKRTGRKRKFNWALASSLYSSGLSQSEIARRLGVSRSSVSTAIKSKSELEKLKPKDGV